MFDLWFWVVLLAGIMGLVVHEIKSHYKSPPSTKRWEGNYHGRRTPLRDTNLLNVALIPPTKNKFPTNQYAKNIIFPENLHDHDRKIFNSSNCPFCGSLLGDTVQLYRCYKCGTVSHTTCAAQNQLRKEPCKKCRAPFRWLDQAGATQFLKSAGVF